MNMNEGRSKRQATSDELNLPKHIKYKIRVDTDNVPSTSLLRGRSVHTFSFCFYDRLQNY